MRHCTPKMLLRAFALLALSLSTICIDSAYAVPAKPGLISVQQPDGSTIKIKVRGDEHFGWCTTEADYPIIEGKDGYYYYAQYKNSGEVENTQVRVFQGGRMMTPPKGVTNASITKIAREVSTIQRSKAAAAESAARVAFPHEGEIKSVVILAEFADVRFSVANPNQAFHDQLNKEGYDVAGATGSARDYFHAQSQGKFNGQFDVYGPYTLSGLRRDYGGNVNGSDKNPDGMVADAVAMADADGVDFSQYDFDEDGFIDNVFVYYAGYNEAEGGPSEAVWPHKWAVQSKPLHDGKKLYVYACTSELRGNNGKTIAGIGTFCHEFSHVFGLYDHYDTDYHDNGLGIGTGEYDIMCEGSYNNEGNTPPMMNAFEMDMIGWCKAEEITSSQSYTINPIQDHQTYKVLTEKSGEIFLIENRNKESIVWDNYIPASGLFITHLDKSSGTSNKWAQNNPNGDPDHECFRYIVAGNVNASKGNWDKVPYPYKANNSWTTDSRPAAKSWADKELDINIIDIVANANGSVNFTSILAGENAVNVIVSKEGEATTYVGDKFQLSAVIYPASTDQSVTWKSSDESVIKVNNEGVAEALKKGTADIIATSTVATHASGKITISTVELQGIRGEITNSEGETLADAQLTFYPVTVSSNAAEQRVYSRVEGATAITCKSNSLGSYRVQIDEGDYELEIKCDRYVERYELIHINHGLASQDFEMVSNADVVDDIKVDFSQSYATITWNPKEYTSFKFKLASTQDMTKTVITTDSRYEATGLKSSAEYTVTVEGSNDGETFEPLYKSSFTTLAKLTAYPIIDLYDYEYSEGEIISLKTLNSSSNDSVVWFIDGVKQDRSKVILKSGEQRIQAEVQRGSATYKVTKVINVK